MTAWNPWDQPVDYVLVSGVRTPGVTTIEGASSPRKWIVQEGMGLTGAVLRFGGVQLAKFKTVSRLYTADHWAEWIAFEPLVRKPPIGTRATHHAVVHPFLERLEITAAAVEDVLQPAEIEPSVWQVEIHWIQFRAPRVTYSKPTAAKTQPEDAVDRDVIRPLTKQLQDLAK